MATLTINGQKVTVDDSFKSLSREQQEATVDEIATSMGKAKSAPQQQPIAQGDWQGLSDRLNMAQQTSAPGMVREGAMAEQGLRNRAGEVKRQGALYGASRPAGETFMTNMEDTLFLGAPNLAKSYLPAWAGGQDVLPGAEAHEFVKAADAARSMANPKSALAGTVAGIVPQAMLPIGAASTMTGRTAQGAAIGAGLSGVQSGITSRGDAQETIKGALLGGAFGGGGSMVAEGVARGAQAIRRTPEDRVKSMILGAAKSERITPQDLAGRMTALGPEGVLADALGESGHSLLRGSNTASPEARAIYGALTNRQAGQNARISDTLENITGFGGKSVAEIQAADRVARQPAIKKAYDDLAARGADLPASAIAPLRNSPAFTSAYDSAGGSVANRTTADAVLTGSNPISGSANSEFARMDAAKRQLDDLASAARNKGERGAAEEYGNLAKAVNKVIDDNLAGAPAARDMARQGFKFSEAVETGADLVRGGGSFDKLSAAGNVAPEFRDALSKGYASAMAERMMRSRSTPGAASSLDTEFVDKAARTALGSKADDLLSAVAREREFARTAAVAQNSKTAEKLFDAKKIASEGGILSGLTAADYYAGTGTGLGGLALGLGRKGAQALSKSRAEKTVQEVAPLIAQALMSRALPQPGPNIAQRAMNANIDPRIPIIAALLGSNLSAVGSAQK